MYHWLPKMLFASLNPRVFRTQCLRTAKDQLLPRIVALRHLMLPEMSRTMPGLNLLQAKKHYVNAAETVHQILDTKNEKEQALLARRVRIDTDLANAACAGNIRAWFDSNRHFCTNDAQLRELLQRFTRLAVESHTLAGVSLFGPPAPRFRADARPLTEVVQTICDRFPKCLFKRAAKPEEKPPATLPIPRTLSRYVVAELVRNAVQNGRPHNEVLVQCFSPPEKCFPGAAVLQVCNIGSRPFRPSDAVFARADPTRPGSLGVGLPQSRAICEMAGGRLDVVSSPAPGGSSSGGRLYRTVATARFYC